MRVSAAATRAVWPPDGQSAASFGSTDDSSFFLDRRVAVEHEAERQSLVISRETVATPATELARALLCRNLARHLGTTEPPASMSRPSSGFIVSRAGPCLCDALVARRPSRPVRVTSRTAFASASWRANRSTAPRHDAGMPVGHRRNRHRGPEQHDSSNGKRGSGRRPR